MKLTIIGSTGSMSGPRAAASCYLVQAWGFDPALGRERLWSVVLDMGPGSFGQLWRYVDPRDVDALLISHGHADHMADIISMHVFLKWHPQGCCQGVTTAGPAELIDRVVQIDGYTGREDIERSFHLKPMTPNATLDVGPLHISAHPGRHPVESYGFRIEGPSEDDPMPVTLAYTGDTDSCEGMVEMADGVDLLLSECGFTDDMKPRGIHLSGTRAGELASTCGVERLVLTHIQPWTDPAVPVAEARAVYPGPVEVAEPGLTWVI